MAYMLVAIAPHQPTNSTFVNQLIPTDPHFALFGAMLAIIPAIVTAVYATLNYNLILSWAVIRRMSPLNIISNQFYFFFKTLILMGAVWAALLTCLTFKLFPNLNLDWTLPFVRKIVDGIFHFFVV